MDLSSIVEVWHSQTVVALSASEYEYDVRIPLYQIKNSRVRVECQRELLRLRFGQLCSHNTCYGYLRILLEREVIKMCICLSSYMKERIELQRLAYSYSLALSTTTV